MATIRDYKNVADKIAKQVFEEPCPHRDMTYHDDNKTAFCHDCNRMLTPEDFEPEWKVLLFY
jgi:hypothetical protein